MGKRSRDKGARGEREAAQALTEATGRPWRRAIGQQRKGSDAPDIERDEADTTTEAWVEVKRGKRPNWRAAMAQAKAETDGRPTWVLTRDDRGAWVLHVELAEVWSLHSVARDALSQRLAKGGKDGNG